MMPSILNMDFSDRTGVGSHKIIWPTIGLAVVARHTWPYQARIAELWNLQFHIYAFSARVFFVRLPVTGMDQLSQRDQMQVMQALNEMQMQENTGFSVGVWWCEKTIGLYCADIRRWWIPTTIWSRSASTNVSQVFARRQGIHGCFYGVSCYHWQQIMEWLPHWLGVPMFRSEVPWCLWANSMTDDWCWTFFNFFFWCYCWEALESSEEQCVTRCVRGWAIFQWYSWFLAFQWKAS